MRRCVTTSADYVWLPERRRRRRRRIQMIYQVRIFKHVISVLHTLHRMDNHLCNKQEQNRRKKTVIFIMYRAKRATRKNIFIVWYYVPYTAIRLYVALTSKGAFNVIKWYNTLLMFLPILSNFPFVQKTRYRCRFLIHAVLFLFNLKSYTIKSNALLQYNPKSQHHEL